MMHADGGEHGQGLYPRVCVNNTVGFTSIADAFRVNPFCVLIVFPAAPQTDPCVMPGGSAGRHVDVQKPVLSAEH